MNWKQYLSNVLWAQTLHLVSGLAIKQNSVEETLPFTSPSSFAIYHSMIPYWSIMEQVYCAEWEATEAADQPRSGLSAECVVNIYGTADVHGDKGHLKAG